MSRERRSAFPTVEEWNNDRCSLQHMETGINFELAAHPTMRTSRVQVVDVGRAFVEFTDRDGSTEIYDLDVGDYQGHRNFLSEDAGVDLPFFRSGKHDRLELTLYYDDTAEAPSVSRHVRVNEYPSFVFSSDGTEPETFAASRVIRVPNTFFGLNFKPVALNAAATFMYSYRHIWDAMTTRAHIGDALDYTDSIQVAASHRQASVDDWGRTHSGLIAAMLWHVQHDLIEFFPARFGQNMQSLTRRILSECGRLIESELPDAFETEFGPYGDNSVLRMFRLHDPNSWANYESNFQIWTTNQETGVGDRLIWTAPDAAWWNSLKTAWFGAAINYPTSEGDRKFVRELYPEKGVVGLSSITPEVGTELRASLGSGVAAPVTDLRYRWQRRDGDSASDIDGTNTDVYTPVSDDETTELRAVISYRDANGFILPAVSRWSAAVVSG